MGTYLTQYFYEPAVGASILIAFWCGLFFLIKKVFKINNTWGFIALIPVVLLLISTIDTGYWVYYLKHPGYWFRPTIGFIYTAVAYFIGSRLNKNIILQSLATIILTFGGYYAFGFYALLVPFCMVVNEWLNEETSKASKSILSAVAILSLIATPLICYNQFFSKIRSEDIWLGGFPNFFSDKVHDLTLEIPFYIISIILVLMPLVKKFQNKENFTGTKAWGVRIIYILLVIVAMTNVVDRLNYDNYNYHAEMRMYRATEECRWDDVLEESANYQTNPTREMVIFNHIAIFNKGKIGTELFKYNNFGESPYIPDTTFVNREEKDANGNMVPVKDDNGNQIVDTLALHVHMVQTAGPLIYYNHAKTNFASRWSIENSVEYGYTFNELKTLVKCALVNGEWDVARKYIDILKKSRNYKEWAEKYEPILKDHSKIKDYHEFDNIIELYNHMGTTLDGDNGLCEMYLINYFANTMNKDSKLLQEVTLMYALIQKDIQLFWPRFFLYAQLHKGEPMPQHYQEAAFLYGNLEHQVDITHMPFDKEIADRYASFQQTSQSYLRQGFSVEQVRDLMKPTFGDTFWWFYFFVRDVKSY